MEELDEKYYKKPVEIADGVYWVGFVDVESKLHCNPYLIIEGDEAVLVDGGSRTDFSTVMLKILQTGVHPANITKLIYSHYDPDLCGNIPDLEEIIGSDNLEVITMAANKAFIKHYGGKSKIVTAESLDCSYTFKTGRRIEFIHVPYVHAEGGMLTYDVKTKTLFTGDVMGNLESDWTIYLDLRDRCMVCDDKLQYCNEEFGSCPLEGMAEFHNKIMTSTKALKYCLKIMERIDYEMIAPQHGSIIKNAETIEMVIHKLMSLDKVGIDAYL